MDDNSEYVILERLPTAEEYHDLRKLAGLTPPPMDAVPKALANSFVAFTAFERKFMIDDKTPAEGQRAVAMGRLLGDHSLFLQLCDMAVHPDHQGKRLGKRIMKALTDYVDEHAPKAYVSLIAEPRGQKLYPQFGFEECKPSIGMYRWQIQDREFQKARRAKAEAVMRSTS
jgi:GNAT superfamily N-acetyltransferase